MGRGKNGTPEEIGITTVALSGPPRPVLICSGSYVTQEVLLRFEPVFELNIFSNRKYNVHGPKPEPVFVIEQKGSAVLPGSPKKFVFYDGFGKEVQSADFYKKTGRLYSTGIEGCAMDLDMSRCCGDMTIMGTCNDGCSFMLQRPSVMSTPSGQIIMDAMGGRYLVGALWRDGPFSPRWFIRIAPNVDIGALVAIFMFLKKEYVED